MKLRKLLSIFIIAVVLMKTFSANAQNDNVALEPLEVKAMRTPTPEKRMPSSVTIITRKDIEQKQARTVADALNGVLGIDVVQNGGMGSTTSVFMRASESNGVLATIDGVRVNLPSTGQFNFGHLTTDNIERIEVLRGSQSTLWGSDAMAGVINIVTRKGEGVPIHSMSFEAGSYETHKESILSSGIINEYDYSLGLARVDTGGFSADSSWRGPTEDDGYRNTTTSWRFGRDLKNDGRVELIGRYSKAFIEYDNSTGVDDDDHADNYQLVMALPFQKTISKRWKLKLTPSYFYRENYARIPGHYKNFDKTTSLDLQNNFKVTEDLSFMFGGEYRNQKGIGVDSSYSEVIDNWSQFVQASYDYQNPDNEYKNFLLTAGYRHDYHTTWDNHVTYKFGGGYYLPKTNTQFHTSYATAFVSPTLDDLYYPPVASTANPDLTPETSKSFEFGFKQNLNERSNLNMTFFNDSRTDMIQLDSSWIPQNSAKVYSRGIETGVTLGFPRNFNLALNHTWNEHYDQDNRPLIRRAKTKFKATLTHTLNKKLDSLVSIYVRGRATGSASKRHTGGFTTVRATLGYQYNKNLKLTLRGENLLDEEYEVKYPSGTAGASGYAGFTYTFN
jgi:vitamin B12 transporter